IVRHAAHVEAGMQASAKCLLVLHTVVPPVAVGCTVVVQISALQSARIALPHVTELGPKLQAAFRKNAWREREIVIWRQVEIVRNGKFHAPGCRGTVGGQKKAGLALLAQRESQV